MGKEYSLCPFFFPNLAFSPIPHAYRYANRNHQRLTCTHFTRRIASITPIDKDAF
jgi:hypothetical protein